MCVAGQRQVLEILLIMAFAIRSIILWTRSSRFITNLIGETPDYPAIRRSQKGAIIEIPDALPLQDAPYVLSRFVRMPAEARGVNATGGVWATAPGAICSNGRCGIGPLCPRRNRQFIERLRHQRKRRASCAEPQGLPHRPEVFSTRKLSRPIGCRIYPAQL